jgi:thioredoxin 1
MSEKAVEVTDASFAEVTARSVALVDFWAERCPPCRMQGPAVEKLARNFVDRAMIGKLDVDSNYRVPTDLGLYCIPTLTVFKDGSEVIDLRCAKPRRRSGKRVVMSDRRVPNGDMLVKLMCPSDSGRRESDQDSGCRYNPVCGAERPYKALRLVADE